MAGRADIQAGGADVYVRLDDSGFKEGIKKIYRDLKEGGKAATIAGKEVGTALNIPIRKSVQVAKYVTTAHKQMSYALVNMGNKLAMTGWHWRNSAKEVAKWREITGRGMTKVGGIMHNFGVRMTVWNDRMLKPIRRFGNRVQIMARRVGAAFTYVKRRFRILGAEIGSIGKQMAVAAIIMAIPFIAGARTYAAFSKQMGFVATMLDDTGKHMGRFTEGIRKLSVEFGESTETLSKGLYDILSASFAPNKALKMLHTTTMAAKAGMTDTASATKAVVAVLNAYNLGAGKALYVSDVLFQTVRYGVLTFGELAGHIGLVASTAAIAGVTIEEMGAVLATMTRAGIEASHAVISFGNILKAFIAPTGAGAEFAKLLKEAGLGIEISARALRNVGIVAVFKELAKLPPDLLYKLFPSLRAIRGAAALKAQIKGLIVTHGHMLNAAGAMQRAYDEVSKTFGFLMDRVKQAGVLILSYLGEALADSLSNVGERIIWFATGFKDWIKVNKNVIITTVKLIAVLAELAVVMIIVGKAIALAGIITAVVSGQWWVLAIALGAGLAAWMAVEKVIGDVSKELEFVMQAGEHAAIGFKKASLELQALERAGLATGIMIAKLEKEQAHLYRLGYARGFVPEYETRRLEQSLIVFRKEATWLKKEIELQKKAVDAAEKKAKAAAKTARALAEQERHMASMGRYRWGFLAGYWHTPVLAYATTSKAAQQLDVLRDIRREVGADGAIVGAIEGKRNLTTP